MCTVTFIPKANGDFVFMSSRDEATSRLTTKPDFYSLKGVKCLFPKDSIAGGTWIGLSEHSRLVCLLNGGYTKHKRQLNYKHSRGKVVRDVLVATDYKGLLYTYDFIDIEPFTLLVVDWQSDLVALELVWDGANKVITYLDNTPRIWSSSTLYNETMKTSRQNWFQEFLCSVKKHSLATSFNFHKNTAPNNKEFGLQIDRGKLKTVSITGVEKMNSYLKMHYFDVLNNALSEHDMQVNAINYE